MSDEPEEVSVDTEEVQAEEDVVPVVLPPETETAEVASEEEEKHTTKRGKKELSPDELANTKEYKKSLQQEKS